MGVRTGAGWPGACSDGAIVLRESGRGGKWVFTDMGRKPEGSPVARGLVVPVGPEPGGG